MKTSLGPGPDEQFVHIAAVKALKIVNNYRNCNITAPMILSHAPGASDKSPMPNKMLDEMDIAFAMLIIEKE